MPRTASPWRQGSTAPSLGWGPFWLGPSGPDLPDLLVRGSEPTFRDLLEQHAAERRAKGAQPVWKLGTPGAVGSEVLMGVPVLWRLRVARLGQLAAWPLEPWEAALADLLPLHFGRAVAEAQGRAPEWPRDAREVWPAGRGTRPAGRGGPPHAASAARAASRGAARVGLDPRNGP